MKTRFILPSGETVVALDTSGTVYLDEGFDVAFAENQHDVVMTLASRFKTLGIELENLALKLKEGQG
jgi:hypothetical protein